LLSDQKRRAELGSALHAYIKEFHHPRKVAENYLRIATSEAPAEWCFDPNKMKDVVGGFFLPRNQVKQVVRDMVKHYGASSLCLDDKPALRDALLTWAG